MRTLREIMRITDSACKKEDNLKVIACRMFLSDFMFLPVVNENKEVIGVVNYKDVISAINKVAELKINLRVEDIMRSVPCLYAYEDEALALKIMRTNKAAHLPVVDKENHLEGVISFMVLARRIVDLKKRMNQTGKLNFGNLEMSI